MPQNINVLINSSTRNQFVIYLQVMLIVKNSHLLYMFLDKCISSDRTKTNFAMLILKI